MSTERDLEGWTIAFDLDGTLVDSAPDLIGTLNRMLAQYELPPTPLSSARHLVGHGAMALLRHGFMEAGAAPGGGPAPGGVAPGAPPWRVGILPRSAGAIAYAKVLVDGVWRDLLRPTKGAQLDNPTACSSFPLIPWSNRVAEARLTFAGRTWQLPRTSPDGTAMHGSVLPFGFEVLERTQDSVRLRLDSRDVVGMGFPWAFSTELAVTLTDDGLSVTTTVTNVDVEAFPAGFGHHPYFVRSLTPDCGEPQLEIPVTAGYALESAMAVGEAGPVPTRADYSTLRPLGSRFVDDCLTGREPGPVRIVYPGARVDGSDVEVRITADDVSTSRCSGRTSPWSR